MYKQFIDTDQITQKSNYIQHNNYFLLMSKNKCKPKCVYLKTKKIVNTVPMKHVLVLETCSLGFLFIPLKFIKIKSNTRMVIRKKKYSSQVTITTTVLNLQASISSI